MKIPREKLELRPIRPRFFSIIPRLPSMVCKRITNYLPLKAIRSTRSLIVQMFRKPASRSIWPDGSDDLRILRALTINEAFQYEILPPPSTTNPIGRYTGQADVNEHNKAVEHVLFGENNRSIDQEQHLPLTNQSPNDPSTEDSSTRLNYHHSIGKKVSCNTITTQEQSCLSCQEHVPAFRTCEVCIQLNSKLPQSSCVKCQNKKPLHMLCQKYHDMQPVIFVSTNEKNKTAYQKLGQLNKRQEVLQECSGMSSTLEQCFICLNIFPKINCTCRDCIKTLPIVQTVRADIDRPAILLLCPCFLCFRFIPKLIMCDECVTSVQLRLQPLGHKIHQ